MPISNGGATGSSEAASSAAIQSHEAPDAVATDTDVSKESEGNSGGKGCRRSCRRSCTVAGLLGAAGLTASCVLSYLGIRTGIQAIDARPRNVDQPGGNPTAPVPEGTPLPAPTLETTPDAPSTPLPDDDEEGPSWWEELLDRERMGSPPSVPYVDITGESLPGEVLADFEVESYPTLDRPFVSVEANNALEELGLSGGDFYLFPTGEEPWEPVTEALLNSTPEQQSVIFPAGVRMWAPIVNEIADEYEGETGKRFPTWLLLAILEQESQGNSFVTRDEDHIQDTSHGLMQVLEDNFVHYGYTDSSEWVDPNVNIEVALRLLWDGRGLISLHHFKDTPTFQNALARWQAEAETEDRELTEAEINERGYYLMMESDFDTVGLYTPELLNTPYEACRFAWIFNAGAGVGAWNYDSIATYTYPVFHGDNIQRLALISAVSVKLQEQGYTPSEVRMMLASPVGDRQAYAFDQLDVFALGEIVRQANEGFYPEFPNNTVGRYNYILEVVRNYGETGEEQIMTFRNEDGTTREIPLDVAQYWEKENLPPWTHPLLEEFGYEGPEVNLQGASGVAVNGEVDSAYYLQAYLASLEDTAAIYQSIRRSVSERDTLVRQIERIEQSGTQANHFRAEAQRLEARIRRLVSSPEVASSLTLYWLRIAEAELGTEVASSCEQAEFTPQQITELMDIEEARRQGKRFPTDDIVWEQVARGNDEDSISNGAYI